MEPPRAALSAPPSRMWGSLAAWPLVSSFPEKKNSEPPVAQVPHSIHHPREPGEGCCIGPWGNFPSKNQSQGIGPPSWGGDGYMFLTSELKTLGPSFEGDRRYSLPSTTLTNLGEATVSALGPRPLEKPKWSDLHETRWSTLEYCE